MLLCDFVYDTPDLIVLWESILGTARVTFSVVLPFVAVYNGSNTSGAGWCTSMVVARLRETSSKAFDVSGIATNVLSRVR